jgi:hypothetical protein
MMDVKVGEVNASGGPPQAILNGDSGVTPTSLASCIKPSGSSCEFRYFQLKQKFDAQPNTGTSALVSKTVTSFDKPGSPNATEKPVVSSIADRSAIAKTLMNWVATEDRNFAGDNKSAFFQHRKPGSPVCLNVLSDLVNVAIESKDAKTPIFKNQDLKELVSIFCPGRMADFNNLNVTDQGQILSLLGEIKKGMTDYLIAPDSK